MSDEGKNAPTEDGYPPSETKQLVVDFPPPSEVSREWRDWNSTFGYSEFETVAQEVVQHLTRWDEEIWIDNLIKESSLRKAAAAVLAHFASRGYLVPSDNESGEYLSYWHVSRRFVDRLPFRPLRERGSRYCPTCGDFLGMTCDPLGRSVEDCCSQDP